MATSVRSRPPAAIDNPTYLVAAWLAGIIVNLLLLGSHYDVALRDLGLLLGSLALARLATAFGPVHHAAKA
jgi:hypothetical protein